MIKTKALESYLQEAITRAPQIDSATLQNSLNEWKVIDIRESSEVTNQGSIANALTFPRGVLEMQICQSDAIENLETPIVLYCQTGGRSSLAALSLIKLGFTSVKSLSGGFNAWKKLNES
ncbi:MAG: rhodanese-like domain-containing protein [Pseudomonadota bacterium]